MSKTSYPSRHGVHSGGGFNAPSRVAGFLGSIKSLLWPEIGLPMVPPRAVPELKGSHYQTLSAMPRPASPRDASMRAPGPAPIPAPMPMPDPPEAHPLRRVAGSAGRWKKRLGEARQTWPLASMDELVETDGHLHKLVELVRLRYRISQESAERQVREFLGPHDAGA